MSDVQSIQGVLWKKKGLSAWKKHWVYADDNNFLQWSGKVRPPRTEAPKYAFKLTTLEIKESTSRKFAFEITHLHTAQSMVFAADDSQSYHKWLRVLKLKITKTVTIREPIDVSEDGEEDSLTVPSITVPTGPLGTKAAAAAVSGHGPAGQAPAPADADEDADKEMDPPTRVKRFFEKPVRLCDLTELIPKIGDRLVGRRVVAVMAGDLHLALGMDPLFPACAPHDHAPVVLCLCV